MLRLVTRILCWLPPLAFVATLLLPLAQELTSFAPHRGLGGVTDTGPTQPPVTLAAWHDGDLQQWVEARIDRELGLRDWMVRIDNQVRFDLFGVTKRPVLGGPDGWLVEDGYLTARTHLMPHQVGHILGRLHEVLLAQAVLAEHGVTLLLLITPSKVETLPQHLPLAYRLVEAAGHRRQIDLVRGAFGFGVLNHLDAQALFERWREQEPDFPLFPRSGTHWSRIAAARTVVHLLDEFERLSGVDVVNLDLAPRQMGKGPGVSEDDMLQLANLYDTTGGADPMPLARTQRRPGDRGTPPGVLLVSSSFAWLLTDVLQDPGVAAPLAVYYYFKSVYEWADGRQQPKRPIDWTPEQLRADVLRYRFVVLECNASKCMELGFGFPAAVLRAFGLPKSAPAITLEQLASLQPLVQTDRR